MKIFLTIKPEVSPPTRPYYGCISRIHVRNMENEPRWKVSDVRTDEEERSGKLKVGMSSSVSS